MFLQRLSYFIRESFRNLRTNPLVGGVSTGIISLSILIFGLFLVIFINFASMFDRWGRRVAMDVYLVQGIESQKIEQIKSTFKKMPEFGKIEFISTEKAYDSFREMLGPQAELLDELGENPLPASFRLTPVKTARNSKTLGAMADIIVKMEGVEEVRYGARWVTRFQAIIQMLRVLGLVIGGILLLASVLIISNTIRLTVYSRSDEIEIMRLVGATETFIRIPFFLEGLFQGFSAGVVAVALLWGLYKLLLMNIHLPLGALGVGQFTFLPPWGMFSLVIGGTLLGLSLIHI